MKINFKRKKQNFVMVKGIQINWYKQKKKMGIRKVNVPVISCADDLVGKLVEHFTSVTFHNFIGTNIKHLYTDDTSNEDIWWDAKVVNVDMESPHILSFM